MRKRSVVVDTAQPGRLVIQETEMRAPRHDEMVVRVKAVSLNRGEVNKAQAYAENGWRPGWDLAGVVEQAAAAGGPQEGQRVVGFVPNGAWAERALVPSHAAALLPDAVTFEQAATLPVAGLTALYALRQGGLLVGRTVLITGATGGVGDFAIQLARLSGAHVTAHVRREDQAALVKQWGADAVAVGPGLEAAAKPMAPFDLVIDSVGAQTLADALVMLKEGGVCVSLGVSAGAMATIDAATFFLTGRARLYGLILFDEVKSGEPASVGLGILANLVAAGRLDPHISVTSDWAAVAEVCGQLLDRRFSGKAVLTIS